MARNRSVMPIFWASSGILKMVMSLFMHGSLGPVRRPAGQGRGRGWIGEGDQGRLVAGRLPEGVNCVNRPELTRYPVRAYLVNPGPSYGRALAERVPYGSC